MTDAEAPRPLADTFWAWEPELEHAAALIKVTSVRWNGEEWHVGAQVLAGAEGTAVSDNTWWNDLSRFWEACHYVAPDAGPNAFAPVRRGAPQPDETGGPSV